MSLTECTTDPTSGRPPGGVPTTTERRRGRWRRRLVVLVVAAIAVVSAGLTSAQPASAATGVRGCFRAYSGLVIGGQWTLLEIYVQGRWHPAAMAMTSSRNGCVSYYPQGDARWYPARIRMESRASTGDWFFATSPYWAPAGTGSYYVGTAIVRCVGFCYLA